MSLILGLRIGAIAGLVAAAIWLFGVFRERAELQDFRARAVACEAAVKAGRDPVASCPQAISDAATRAQRYRDCEAGLAGRDLYVIRAACSAAVKRRDAEATALAFSNAVLARDLATARDQLAAGLARADARFDALLRKDKNASQAISAAPRRPDGRVACDADCLRRIVGDEAAAAQPRSDRRDANGGAAGVPARAAGGAPGEARAAGGRAGDRGAMAGLDRPAVALGRPIGGVARRRPGRVPLMDSADEAAWLTESERAEGVRRVRGQLRAAGAADCIGCGEAIEPDRRAALPSAQRCIICQGRVELRGRTHAAKAGSLG